MMSIPLRLIVEPDQVLGPVNELWRFGVNTCHAPLWLRDDHQRHLVRAKRELGIRYVRCHELLGRNLVRVKGDTSFDYSRMLAAIDRVITAGLRPFFGLCSMPDEITRGRTTLSAYRFNTSPPRDWGLWRNLVSGAVRSCVDRYGLAEVREWYFEVWNEPDIPYWAGTQAEYFKLYDVAASAIKEIDASLRVGGPATARTAWMADFCHHVARPSADFDLPGSRCDFISTHLYPSDLAFLDAAHGQVIRFASDFMGTRFAAARETIDTVLGPSIPLICGEWNSSAGPLASNHDDCNNAAFIVKTMIDLAPYCTGSLFWSLSDIYEECGFHEEPFHGGYGIITVNDLPKAGWHAFRLLALHRGLHVKSGLTPVAPGAGVFASRDGNTVRVMIYYLREADQEQQALPSLEIVVDPVGAEEGTVSIEHVGPGSGSAYETWCALGSPKHVTPDTLERLRAASGTSRRNWKSGKALLLPPGTIAQLTWNVAAG